ncbi:MAG: hypothetical protein HBSAPP03_30300 [Phycisphaerae bacterium]|nr:MAG: hypothetical protein HBSAPP03_30300 [Phycisphaerae bacterium]
MINPGTLEITSGTPQVRSVFFNTRQPIQTFMVSFRLQAVSLNPISTPQGVCLINQNNAAGAGAVGLGNGGLGFAGMQNARALAIYAVDTTRVAWGVAPGTTTGAAQLASNRPLDVTMNYVGTQLSVTIDDPALPGVEYIGQFEVGSLSTQLGNSQAFIGFSASTGTATNLGGATFHISDIAYSAVPAPGAVALGAACLIAARRRRDSM